MTTAPERPAARRSLRWDERSLLSDYRGVRSWLAVSLALALTATGVFTDIQRQGRLGVVFHACYLLGCLLAVVAVQRKGLFGPMVQPPLVLAIAVPSVVLLAGSVPTSGGAATTALAVGTPLINGFPAMAITTGVTLAVGAFRVFTQRRPTGSPATQSRRSADQPAEQPARPVRTPAAERPRKPSPRPVRTGDIRPADRPADAESLTEPVPRMTEQALTRHEQDPRHEQDRAPRRRRRPQP